MPDTVATYAYDGLHRRTHKVVSNSGPEETPGDGGNTTVHFYYDSQWRIIETRNGSNQTTMQVVPGTQYTDEIAFVDVNGVPSASNDCDIDVTAGGESSENPADARYFVHQDRNWNVVALTEYRSGGGAASRDASCRDWSKCRTAGGRVSIRLRLLRNTRCIPLDE